MIRKVLGQSLFMAAIGLAIAGTNVSEAMEAKDFCVASLAAGKPMLSHTDAERALTEVLLPPFQWLVDSRVPPAEWEAKALAAGVSPGDFTTLLKPALDAAAARATILADLAKGVPPRFKLVVHAAPNLNGPDTAEIADHLVPLGLEFEMRDNQPYGPEFHMLVKPEIAARPLHETLQAIFASGPNVLRVGDLTRAQFYAFVGDGLIPAAIAPGPSWNTRVTGSGVDLDIAKARRLTALSNTSAFRVFQKLARREPKNALVSAFGSESALLAAALGAGGQTRVEILQAMGLLGVRAEDVLEGRVSLRKAWEAKHRLGQNDNFIFLAGMLLNAAGLDAEAQASFLTPAFTAEVTRVVGGQVAAFDFRNAEAARQHTLLSDSRGQEMARVTLDPTERFVLFNFVRTQDKFVEEFDYADPADFKFKVGSGETVETVDRPMLRSVDKHSVFTGATLRAVSIPFRKLQVRIDLIQPKPGHTLDSLIARMDGAMYMALAGELDRAEKKLVDLRVPYVKGIELDVNLIQLYRALGLNLPFGGADFSGITTKASLYVQRFSQKVKYYFHKDNAGASALTIMGFGSYGTMMPPEPPPAPRFDIDGSHLVVFRDLVTGRVLFTFKIVDPQ